MFEIKRKRSTRILGKVKQNENYNKVANVLQINDINTHKGMRKKEVDLLTL